LKRKKRLSKKALRLRNRRIFDEAYPKDGTPGPPRIVLANRHGLTVSGLTKALRSAANEIRATNERLYLAQTQQIPLEEPETEITSEGLVTLLEDLLTRR
jgi:hypothetical protein